MVLGDVFSGKGLYIAAGLTGAVLSLAFVKNLSPWQGVWSVAGGAGCAAFIAPTVIQYLGIAGPTEYALVFLCGFVGLNILGGIMKLAEKFREGPIEFLRRLKAKDD